MPILCSIDAAHVVALAEREPSSLTRNLGTTEQRDALDALRRRGRARQHQVDDVVGEVVLAEADEDLLALDPVVIALRRVTLLRMSRGRNRPAVRFIVPVHCPRPSCAGSAASANRCRAGTPTSIAPWVRSGAIENAMFDAFHISITAVSTSLGSPGRRKGVEAQAVPARLDELWHTPRRSPWAW